MFYALLADLVVVFHMTFILFVIFGGGLVFWRPKAALAHLPIALYGVLIEFIGWVCPLTPLEKYLRRMAGTHGYEGGFIDHYLLPIIYPDGLTPEIQLVLGGLVILVNVVIYGSYLIKQR